MVLMNLFSGKEWRHRYRECTLCTQWGRERLGRTDEVLIVYTLSDTAEGLLFHFSLSRTGEGNGTPLQCSCLENPRDGGACWAAVYGVAQSWTRLKWLSSSSSSRPSWCPPKGSSQGGQSSSRGWPRWISTAIAARSDHLGEACCSFFYHWPLVSRSI